MGVFTVNAAGAPGVAGTAIGFPASYGQRISNVWSNSQGDNVVITPAVGSALVAVVIGMRSYPPFDLLHTGNSNAAFVPDLLSFNAPPTMSDNSADAVAITNAAELTTAFVLSAVANASAGSTVYTGTITGGGVNLFVGYFFQVAGFANPLNNGYFLCTANTTTTLTLSNPSGVAVTAAGTATDNVVTITTAANNFVVGDIVTLSGLTTKTWLNGQSQAVVTSGAAFTINDSTKHVTAGAAAETGLASRTSGNNWAQVTGKVDLSNNGADYTASLGNFTLSSKWSLDGYYPAIYMFLALNVSGGKQTVSVNTVFEGLTTRPANWGTGGTPIFNGGVDIIVFEIPNTLAVAAADQSNGQLSTAAIATSGAFTTAGTGDLILTAGVMKSGNAFSTSAAAGTTNTTMIASGKCVGGEAHWGIQAALQTAAGAVTPGFANPLGYEMAVVSLALKHS